MNMNDDVIIEGQTHSFGVPKITKSTASNRVQSQLVWFSVLVNAIWNHPNGLPFSVGDLS